MNKFQVQLSGEWQDYPQQENQVLMRSYLSGFECARYTHRGQTYLYNFKRMVQINTTSGKERSIRPPRHLKSKAPSKPIIQAGPTMGVRIPPGASGKMIYVPHPKRPGEYIAVDVPASAKPGQQMLVPVPETGIPSSVVDSPGASTPAGPAPVAQKAGRSTGAKIAMGLGGAAVVGGAVVGGVVLGDAVAEHGWDGVGESIGDAFESTGEAIGDFAGDAWEWTGDAAEDVGEFITDLF